MLPMLRRIFNRIRTPLTMVGSALLGVFLVFAYLHFDPPSGKYSDRDIAAIADKRISEAPAPPPLEPQVFANVRPSVVQIPRPLPADPQGHSSGRGVGSVSWWMRPAASS